MDKNHGLTVLGLTSSTVAQFRIQWLFSAELVLYLATMAAGLVSSLEVFVLVVDTIWWPLLPILDRLLVLASGL